MGERAGREKGREKGRERGEGEEGERWERERLGGVYVERIEEDRGVLGGLLLPRRLRLLLRLALDDQVHHRLNLIPPLRLVLDAQQPVEAAHLADAVEVLLLELREELQHLPLPQRVQHGLP